MSKMRTLPVMRDFIPTTEEATRAERERFSTSRSVDRGRTVQDFIPGEDHVLKPPAGDHGDEAIARAMAKQATSAREEFLAAVEKLKTLNVAQAIDYITKAPYAVAEMTLVAEMLYGNRKSVLDRFGAVDPAAVKRWEDINSGQPDSQVGGLGSQSPQE